MRSKKNPVSSALCLCISLSALYATGRAVVRAQRTAFMVSFCRSDLISIYAAHRSSASSPAARTTASAPAPMSHPALWLLRIRRFCDSLWLHRWLPDGCKADTHTARPAKNHSRRSLSPHRIYQQCQPGVPARLCRRRSVATPGTRSCAHRKCVRICTALRNAFFFSHSCRNRCALTIRPGPCRGHPQLTEGLLFPYRQLY